MPQYLVSLQDPDSGIWNDSGHVFNSPGETEKFVLEQDLKASISQQ